MHETAEEKSNQARGHKANLSNPSACHNPMPSPDAICLLTCKRHQRQVKGTVEAGAEGSRRRRCILQQG
jgi:hypothetical protein